jgi:hypothetical protein
VVSQPREKGGKRFWHEVGVVWPQKSGNDFDVVLYGRISIHGRIVGTEPKDREPKPASPGADTRPPSRRPQPR